ncbi:molybdopterin oxidoreductase family protein [Zavarzinella formosa]|uniref:molybdopterin oxidoreductase family protein n=1 Tax=Zavarzinella formosa TaxID=360055 RepID=UPI000378379A|nr:molybdopterin oxidoreductase family protein [Zavarzinella formosa]
MESVASPTKTHCPYCAFQCGIEVSESSTTVGWVATGDADFPVNNGQLCIKGWTSANLLTHPERLTKPLLRTKSGRLAPVGWDEALDFVAAGIQTLRQRHGVEAMGLFGSGVLTNEKAYLLGKFARVAVGTPNIDYNGRFCMSSAAAAGNKAFGIDRGLPFPVSDIEKAEVILLVGANSADTLPPIMQWFDRQKAAGGRLIVADPRRTSTARRADLHLPVTPGTDLALANGLMFIAIEEKLIDPAYIEARTNGFEAMRRAVLAYEPAYVERLTGVRESALRQTVRWLAGATSAMILTGRGPEQQSKGVDSVLGFVNLMLALGKIGRPASGFGTLTGQGNGQGGREHGQKADQLPGYRLIEVDAHREIIAKVWGVDPKTLPRKGKSAYELLDSLGPVGGIRGLLVMGSNVAVASPHSGRIIDRLKSLEMLVVCDAFPNETSEHAHVVLPVYQWAEEEGTLTNLEGRVIRRRIAAPAPEGVRGDIDILRGLAERLGCGDKFAFDSPRDVFEEFRRATAGGTADYAGITYERIDTEDGVFWPCPAEDHPGTPRLFAERFAHPDGRAKFHAVEHRPAGEEPDGEYPLYYTTGRYKEHYNSGAQTRLVGELTAAKPRPLAQIHPRLASRFGATAGSVLVLESRRGRAEFAAEVTTDIRPDTVFVPFHWGGSGAANLLTNPSLDPTSRMPEYKVAAVRISEVRPAGEVSA